MTTPTDKPLPCPFCGSQPTRTMLTGSVCCETAYCPASHTVVSIERWNTRADSAPAPQGETGVFATQMQIATCPDCGVSLYVPDGLFPDHWPEKSHKTNAPKCPGSGKVATPSASAAETPGTECEFCEIDGMGNHAPRCPVSLERELADRCLITEDLHKQLADFESRTTALRADLTTSQAREQAAVAEVERLKTELLRRKD